MRVLHVYRTYHPDTYGGIEEVIAQLCRNTVQHGIENRVFCLSPDPSPKVLNLKGTEIHRARRSFEIASCGFSLGGFKAFEENVQWADVVNYHFPWPFGDILHLFSEKKKPSMVTYHSDIIRQKHLLKLYLPIMHKFFEQMDCIIAASPNYYATSTTLCRYSDKVKIIPYGLDPSSYPAVDPADSANVRELYGQDYFLFIGALRYYKGLHILLEAAEGTDLPVVIAGAGPTESDLIQEAEKQNLTNVSFLGTVDPQRKVSLLENAKCVVFPSHLRSEAFGVTLLEGSMFAKPLISCEIGTGTSYVNKDNETGIVVPPSNAKGLREAMQRINAEPDTAANMGINARKRFDKIFTGKAMGVAYAKIYKELALKR